jgi:uncharacterized protein YkwD
MAHEALPAIHHGCQGPFALANGVWSLTTTFATKTMNIRLTHLSIAFLVVGMALADCGGGGSGSNSSSNSAASNTSGATNTSGTPPASNPNPFNTSVAAPTYVSSSFAYGFFNALNKIRNTMGLGLLAQDATLDVAAGKHADYLATNYNPATMASAIDPTTGMLYAHSEDAGMPLFYGTTPAQRDSKAGYTAFSPNSAETAHGISLDDSVSGAYGLRILMNSLYHRAAVLNDGVRSIGIGINAAPNAFEPAGWAVEDFGMVKYPAPLANGTITVFPLNGTVFDFPYFRSDWEMPNAVPGVLAGTPLSGAISVQIPEGDFLGVTSFTLADGNGAIVPVYLRTPATDTSGLVPRNFAAIFAQSPLNLGATYTASFVGTDNGTAVSKTWSFTTPANAITTITPGPLVVHNGQTLVVDLAAPSGYPGLQGFTTTLSGAQFSVAPIPSSESIQVAIPVGAVVTSTTLSIHVNDVYMSSVPTASITITVAP